MHIVCVRLLSQIIGLVGSFVIPITELKGSTERRAFYQYLYAALPPSAARVVSVFVEVCLSKLKMI